MADRPIKIAHMIDHLGAGGAQRVLSDLATRLPRAGFEITIVNMRGPTALAEELGAAGVRVLSLGIPRRRLMVGKMLRSVLRDINPEIVHTHLDFSNTFGARAAVLSGVPVVIRHDHTGHPRDRRYRARRELAERLIPGKTKIIAVSRDVRDFNVALGIDPGDISVIGNAVDPAKFSLDVDPADLGFGLDRPPVVGFVGRFVSYKGIRYLVEAAGPIRESVPAVKFVLVGDGPLRSRVEARIHLAGLDDSFILTGLKPDPERYHRSFDVVAVPSIREPFGLCVIEAMAMARPVVASSVGGVRDIIEDGVNGFLVPPRDPAALAKAVIRLLRDAALAREIGEAAHRRARQDYSIESSIAKVIDLYRSAPAAVRL